MSASEIGRNIAVDAVKTDYMFLLDDDHVITENLNLDRLCDRFDKNEIDILGVRQGSGGRPTMLSKLMNGQRIWIHRGETRRNGYVAWCDMSSNAFLARTETSARCDGTRKSKRSSTGSSSIEPNWPN